MSWLTLLDLFGVFVFALSGGFDAAKYKLDVFGVLVLAVATGVGGGIMRDVLLGVTPPDVFVNEVYLLTCLTAGLLVIVFANRVERHFVWVKVADAIGLGIFAAIGAAKASDHNLGWVGVLMISVLSAAGGGVVRDVLLREIPLILRADFYASAALLGGGIMLLLESVDIPAQLKLMIAALIAITARLIAMRLNLSLPRVGHY